MTESATCSTCLHWEPHAGKGICCGPATEYATILPTKPADHWCSDWRQNEEKTCYTCGNWSEQGTGAEEGECKLLPGTHPNKICFGFGECGRWEKPSEEDGDGGTTDG